LERRKKISNARSLRRRSTDAERRLWRFLRNRQLGGYRFRRQVPLGRFVVDFACMDAKLIVELDGGQHADHTADDAARTQYLQRGGFRVLRFWNDDALLRTEAVLEQVLQTLRDISPHPNPLPQAGEGEHAEPELTRHPLDGPLPQAGEGEHAPASISPPSATTRETPGFRAPAPRPPPPLALYIHIPWCVKKCPYCDFNSHGLRAPMPERESIAALLADLDADLTDFGDAVRGREVVSVFFGGGTPSLFQPSSIAAILDGAAARLRFAHDCEITLETNPGTVEHGRFDGYLKAGVNRISIGVQSFADAELAALGRIHSAGEAEAAVKLAQDAGCTNLNLDLMYALPRQTLAGALADVDRAIALAPTHISHYQLTLEPGTPFAKRPPPLPSHDAAWDMQEACQARLAAAGYAQYEISAYAQSGRRCRHNVNYWEFGDYLGIGAGAHGKVTAHGIDATTVRRRWKIRSPRAYLQNAGTPQRIGGDATIAPAQLPFEFMLNALRLNTGVPLATFCARTGLPLAAIAVPLQAARANDWLVADPDRLQATALGQRFLNDVIEAFMPPAEAPQRHA
jgi:oxygen-independent coproporphyrinogen-3 oxidase